MEPNLRFVFTLSLPTAKGDPVQEIIGEHPAKTLSELCAEMSDQEWILVRQFYSGRDQRWEFRTEMLLKTCLIGRVKPFLD